MKLQRITLSIAALILTTTMAQAVDYPTDYRHWSHVKTLTLHAGHALENPFMGIHHIYANPAALEGLRTGIYPDGAVLAFDLLESITADHATAEGERLLLGVMQKDRKTYAATGGWGFQGWSGNSRTERLVKDNGESCFACHTTEKERDYVFSHWRD